MFRSLWTTISMLGPLVRGLRIGRAIGALMGMLLAIAAMSIVRCQESRDPIVGQETAVGRFVAVVAPPGYNYAKGSVVIASGDTLRFMVSYPLPTVGDRVPLQVAHHRSGKKVYTFDNLAWLENGPICR